MASPSANSKCCILRSSSGPNWFKSTMMKGMISGNVKKETEKNMIIWCDIVRKRHGFVEKKRERAASIGGKKKKGKKNYESS